MVLTTATLMFLEMDGSCVERVLQRFMEGGTGFFLNLGGGGVLALAAGIGAAGIGKC
ncbi:hypothetical protein [Bartonella sp. MM73XJBT.G]|uniref:hypothetical protein n=1 Tax=Bartonella sp. MM73XJBT.G TaxID=3019097 RepID=UPI00235FDEE4|nr:hypothetical protein [Bartonella sp. MM73XJBT.G]